LKVYEYGNEKNNKISTIDFSNHKEEIQKTKSIKQKNDINKLNELSSEIKIPKKTIKIEKKKTVKDIVSSVISLN
jgi:hypothetical protein